MITNIKQRVRLCCIVLPVVAMIALTGCNAETKLTPKEQANIKGTGVMPPEARARMTNMMQEAQAKMAADKSAPKTQR